MLNNIVQLHILLMYMKKNQYLNKFQLDIVNNMKPHFENIYQQDKVYMKKIHYLNNFQQHILNKKKPHF